MQGSIMFAASYRLAVLFPLAVAACSGCAYFDLRKNIPWGAADDGMGDRPIRVVSVWTDTVLSQGTGAATRGFGGRVMFYAKEEGSPIKVKGSLVVYAFDETNRDPSNVVPERKFVFTPEEFAGHYSKSSLGHSYSVWIPWDKAGGLQTEISLLVRFQAEDGSVVVGQQSTHMLPGALNPNAKKHNGAGNSPAVALQAPTHVPTAIQPVSYQSPVAANQTAEVQPHVTGQAWTLPNERMATTTIPLAGRLGNRLPTSSNAAQSPQVNGMPPGAAVNGGATVEAQAPAGQAAGTQVLGQPSTHFAPGRSRPLGGPIARLGRDRGPWRPPHAGWPSDPGSQPAPGPVPGPAANAGSVQQALR
jgi:hypothetical protein